MRLLPQQPRARLFATSLVMTAALAACGGGSDAPPATPTPVVEATPVSLALEKIGGFTHAGGPSSAEITAYDPLTKRLFVINGALASVDVLDLSNPAAPSLITSISAASIGPGLAAINSVAVFNGVVALAVEANPKTSNGVVAWVRASDLTILGTDTVGALPDMLTFTPDGSHLLVANEGEPNSYGLPDSVDPVGSVSVIALAGVTPNATSVTLTRTVSSAGFGSFDGQIASLRTAGVRIYGPNATVAQDLEPEYITVSADSKTAYVTLQENNAIATVDIASKTITSVKPLGFKDHSLAGMGMDVSDEDAGTNTDSGTPLIKIGPVPVKGMYLPDAIASYTAGGQTWLITANEGDARADWPGFNEETRVRAHCSAAGLDPTVFTDAANQIFDSNLGRLRITSTPNGGSTGKNVAGECNELYSFGARSFSIWSTDVNRVFDSGDDFEQRTQALPNVNFNASNDNNTLENRSPSKGPEPEGVTVGTFGSKTYAFIGLERVGGVMVYDVTNPNAPVYTTYLNTRTGATGDRGPEGLTLIKAAQSPNGKPLLVVGNETSGTTAVFQINLAY
ncbi:MAG: choice-of-anchor I family protein [Hydrogenophaga sp.]|uniref:choice-of-anchor I family protein n=1 Tax=Hydrogenophaga sp. TaxID=1904254 RepID=UPI002AB969EF|nr:choice-of-anchor I family protein [Hydrogenophaga sp.]MDZ4100896.1 choice-of-anchor I family protein [Hydrogenophaga sp.]